MRSTAMLTLLLLALCGSAPALAGTFAVPFNSGVPMGAAGWIAKGDAGAICGFEGTGTVFLNAGSVPAHSGCFYLFNAPAAAQIVSVVTTYAYSKATAATALCTYSFSALPGDTLRRCEGGTFENGIATNGANWVELGLYNEGSVPIALATARANNVVFVSGAVTLSDPTAPGLAAGGPSGVQTGLSLQLQWSASDPESGAPAVAYAIDGGALVGLRGQACSWLCGTGASGDSAVDLSGLGDGPHSITVYSSSYADAGASVGPLAFTVDRTAPAQPQIHIAPDPSALVAGWWGHAPIALSLSTGTAADVISSRLLVYGPSGALVLDQTSAGSLASAGVPASALGPGGLYGIEVIECDAAGHCSTSARANLRWDGAAAPVPVDGFAPPLGALAARDGGHLTWPALAGVAGGSGIAGAFVGVGPTAASARAQALAATLWEAGAPGVSESAIPAGAIHGSEQACVAIRPISGAGVAAVSAGVRCAAVDEQAPEVTLRGALPWSGGPQTVALTVSDAGGATFSEVLLDGASVALRDGALAIAGEGSHVLRAVAHDSAGNETVVERALGVDASAPSIGSVSVDFLAREVRVGVADALSGVARVELRLAGAELETRLSADGRTAVARVPAGLALDGASVAVRALDASSPANASERSASLPVRSLPVLKGLSAARGLVTGRLIAAGAARVRVWAYPKGRKPRRVGTYEARADGTFAVRVRPRRTTRYAVAVPESQQFRGLVERVAGTVPVTAHIEALQLRVRGDQVRVRARFEGRGEATRLHLLVHDVRGGRWVEGCLEHGKPGVRLELDGRVHGTCRIPPSARGRAWTYRLVLAAPSSTWPWRTPSSASRSLLLPLE
jgi:hypothetical protein